MKYLPLLFANLTRRKTRTLLTVGSFAMALFLFGLLLAVRAAFNQGVDIAAADRLFVLSKVSFIQPLPLAHRDRILKVPGVKDATFANWFGGVYQDPKNFIPQFAIDSATYREVYPEFNVPDDQWQAFMADRQGCVAGKLTADRYGWKLGDRIPIQGAGYPGLWEFNLRAIYTGKRPNDDLSQFWFHWTYLDEKGPQWTKGRVGWYVVHADAGVGNTAVSRGIDELFVNSASETRTQTESTFAASFVKQMGNIEFLMLSIGGVVFFTLLLVTGNTMAMSVRERTGELAVLKTVGFGDGFVLALVLAESLAIAVAGGVLGIGLAKLLTLAGDPTNGMLPGFYLAPLSLAVGLGLALVVGVVAGLIPAWSAMRLHVVDALRRV